MSREILDFFLLVVYEFGLIELNKMKYIGLIVYVDDNFWFVRCIGF